MGIIKFLTLIFDAYLELAEPPVTEEERELLQTW